MFPKMSGLFLAAVLLFPCAAGAEDGGEDAKDALTSPGCVTVSAKESWHGVKLAGDLNRIASVRGAWTVDARNCRMVGPEGHSGRDAQLLLRVDYLKYDENSPFGALLIAVDNAYNFAAYPEHSEDLQGKTVFLRINDKEVSFGDNAGALNVCFE